RALRHQPAMARSHLRALAALPDRTAALEVHRDLVASAVEMLGVRGAGPEDGMENRRRTAVLARNGQTELGDRPAVPLLHVLGLDVVDVHQWILERHGDGQSTLAPESLMTLSYLS